MELRKKMDAYLDDRLIQRIGDLVRPVNLAGGQRQAILDLMPTVDIPWPSIVLAILGVVFMVLSGVSKR